MDIPFSSSLLGP